MEHPADDHDFEIDSSFCLYKDCIFAVLVNVHVLQDQGSLLRCHNFSIYSDCECLRCIEFHLHYTRLIGFDGKR